MAEACRPFVHPAADRWAALVWTSRTLPYDPKTLADWARSVSMSVPTLRARCYVAGVSSKASLSLGRVLRAIHIADLEGINPGDVLDIKEPRTERRLLKTAGLTENRSSGLTVTAFLVNQLFVTAKMPLDSLRRLAEIESKNGHPGPPE